MVKEGYREGDYHPEGISKLFLKSGCIVHFVEIWFILSRYGSTCEYVFHLVELCFNLGRYGDIIDMLINSWGYW